MRVVDAYSHSAERATVIAAAVGDDGRLVARVRRWTTVSSSFPLDVTLTRALDGTWHHGAALHGVGLERLYAAGVGESFVYRRRTYTRVDERDANLPGRIVVTPPAEGWRWQWPSTRLSASEQALLRRNLGLAADAPLPRPGAD